MRLCTSGSSSRTFPVEDGGRALPRPGVQTGEVRLRIPVRLHLHRAAGQPAPAREPSRNASTLCADHAVLSRRLALRGVECCALDLMGSMIRRTAAGVVGSPRAATLLDDDAGGDGEGGERARARARRALVGSRSGRARVGLRDADRRRASARRSDVLEEQMESVLTSDRPSAWSRQFLDRLSLDRALRGEPPRGARAAPRRARRARRALRACSRSRSSGTAPRRRAATAASTWRRRSSPTPILFPRDMTQAPTPYDGHLRAGARAVQPRDHPGAGAWRETSARHRARPVAAHDRPAVRHARARAARAGLPLRRLRDRAPGLDGRSRDPRAAQPLSPRGHRRRARRQRARGRRQRRRRVDPADGEGRGHRVPAPRRSARRARHGEVPRHASRSTTRTRRRRSPSSGARSRSRSSRRLRSRTGSRARPSGTSRSRASAGPISSSRA